MPIFYVKEATLKSGKYQNKKAPENPFKDQFLLRIEIQTKLKSENLWTKIIK